MCSARNLTAVLALALAAGVAGAADNLLVDGGFEGLSPTGGQGPGVYLGGHTDGWYVQSSGCYLYWGGAGSSETDGQCAHLNGGATLQQPFATTPGASYTVSFMATSSEPTAPEKHAVVWIDDGDIHATAPAGGIRMYDTGQVGTANYWDWPDAPYTFDFTATGVTTTLSVAGYNRVPVDTFIVTLLTSPPPTTWHPGDANKDGVVDLQDFGSLKDSFGAVSGAIWDQGDFNADGAIDLQDFGILKDHFGHTNGDSPVTAVPEPASIAMLLGLAAALRRRRA